MPSVAAICTKHHTVSLHPSLFLPLSSSFKQTEAQHPYYIYLGSWPLGTTTRPTHQQAALPLSKPSEWQSSRGVDSRSWREKGEHLAGQGAVGAAVAESTVASRTRAATVHTVVWTNQSLVLGGEEDGLCMVDGVCLDSGSVNVGLDVSHLDHITVHVSSDLQATHTASGRE